MSSEEHYSDGLETEYLVTDILGKRYHGLATAYQQPALFRRDIRKVVKKLGEDVDKLLAPEHFKEYCRLQVERMHKGLKTAKSADDYRKLFLKALKLASTLLGHHFQSGNKREEPYFIPSVWTEKQAWNDFSEYMKSKENLYNIRRQLVRLLIKEGHTHAEIKEIMNISGYRVAQIVRELRDGDKRSK